MRNLRRIINGRRWRSLERVRWSNKVDTPMIGAFTHAVESPPTAMNHSAPIGQGGLHFSPQVAVTEEELKVDDSSHGGYAVVVEDEKHVVAGRCQVAVNRRGDSQRTGTNGKS
jgi:hypothetical protein